MMKELTLPEVIAQTGISERNIKYWSAFYDLEVVRRGRKNFYPRRTIDLLKVIAELSQLQIFTTNFVRWLVDTALRRPMEDAERFQSYKNRFQDLSIRLGMELPVIPGIDSRIQSPSRRPAIPPSGSIEDDALL